MTFGEVVREVGVELGVRHAGFTCGGFASGALHLYLCPHLDLSIELTLSRSIRFSNFPGIELSFHESMAKIASPVIPNFSMRESQWLNYCTPRK
jgi:hypothetical protein